MGTKEGWKPRSNNLEDEEEAQAAVAEQEEAADEIVARPFPQPTSNKQQQKRQRPQQRPEDFMDEQDHDEWGGPTAIRNEYNDTSAAAASTTAAASTNKGSTATTASDENDATGMEQWMKINVEPPAHVGHRLLRVLGWRDGNSSAYVPEHSKKPTASNNVNNENDNQEAHVVLSSKKLRKVQLQQQRVRIPPPKLDTCGLGYEPYENAPEFKAYKDRRRKLAQQRAKLESTSNNVYRVSDVLEGGDDVDDDDNTKDRAKDRRRRGQTNGEEEEEDDAYVSYETIEDFVGQKSVGGFALREDDDQAYDNDPMALTRGSNKVRLDTEAYNNEIYENSSDDDDVFGNAAPLGPSFRSSQKQTSTTNSTTIKTSAKGTDFEGLLSTFADTGGGGASANTTTNVEKAGGVTADGRSALSGFVLGGTFASHSMPKRYRGPDVPLSYQTTRHEFAQEEHPQVLKALSRAVQLEVVDKKRQQAMEEALRDNATSNAPSRRTQLNYNNDNSAVSNNTERSQAPMAGGAFVGLAQAMKNRFTSVVEDDKGKNLHSGLRIISKEKESMHQSIAESNDCAVADSLHDEHPTELKRKIKITRTTHTFAPNRLLCKRFQVTVPASSSHGTTTGPDRITEALYFQKEILQPAAATDSTNNKDQPDGSNSSSNKPKKKPQSKKSTLLETLFTEDGTMKDDGTGADPKIEEVRPCIQIYKSIFEPQSDSEDGELESELENEDDAHYSHDLGEPSQDIPINSQKDPSQGSTMKSPPEELDEQQVENETGADGVKETEGTAVTRKDRDRKKKKKRSKSRKSSRDRRHRSRDRDADDECEAEAEGSEQKDRKRSKRSRSVSGDSTDLDCDSGSNKSEDRERKSRHRDRKDRRKHKHKKKKKSKGS